MSTTSRKTALVTGASRGIGKATAQALAVAGSYVLVHYNQSEREAREVVDAIRADGGKADIIQADLSKAEGPTRLAEGTKILIGDRLDTLVLNAGTSGAALIEEQTIEKFDEILAINVRAPYFAIQQLLPLLGDGSNVVLLSSIVVRTALGRLSAYAGSKGALDTIVRHLAAPPGERGIRINAVAPGVIATDLSTLTKSESGRIAVMDMQIMKRIGQPEDVAPVIAFLASDAARWMTGTTLSVDGGTKI
jgi:NAD(P)-dependent dehydrogenase (short-subunit alcohol dehydrogenase family)